MHSPCIKNCKLNKDNVCAGCFRTIDEIKFWSKFSLNEKKQVIERIEQQNVNKYSENEVK
jgi:predicted Fe-S protein YdhL (DUF1289 family)